FSTAMPPAQAAAAREAIRIARTEPDRRARVLSNAAQILRHHEPLCHHDHERSEGEGSALSVVPAVPALPAVPAVSPIIPIQLGDEATTMRIGGELATRGFLVGAVRPPTVPVGGSRLRITASAAHTPEQIDALGAALAELLAR
ncbi:MAG TPA: aminotransferase class I/II-fold pyridoxal phosphate-dependent enzyme, partial [Gemmatimonadaceae bacterium]